ncbi:MFS transporter [Arthrobacter globiformis]|uniref:MFS transporter n=1 Tax=Arthrobacter globiformis TaxID=1665 RepID=A0A328HKX5_ARTGO|nr:MFS transporter [Arthrobacter globiformis]RAM38105.1 MFS transporter [Arthrobacter globiformis]
MGSLNRGTAEQKSPAEQEAPGWRTAQRGQPTPDLSRKSGGLARYVAAAALARTADGGVVVAIVLMVTTSGAPGWLAGVLGACITAPHLLGPLVARSLDSCRDGRVLIAWACVLHGATLAAAVLLYPVIWPAVTGVLLVTSGLVGPLLTGGISSRLPAIAGPDQVSQRRAQGWDVATYGIGGTIGPSVVAAVSAWAGPTAAALILAAATFVAAAVVRLLPYAPPAARAADVPKPAEILRLMAVTGRLRRMLYLTVTVAFSVAALPIAAVASTAMFQVQPAASGVLTAAYGLGGLAGSAGVMCRPLRGDADRLVTRLAGLVAAALAVAAQSASFAPAVAAYGVAGVMNSYFFAATLAARSEFAPPQVRAQVFVWVGALKIAAGSAGTAAAGVVITGVPQLPLFLAAALILTVAGTSALDRRSASRLGPGG